MRVILCATEECRKLCVCMFHLIFYVGEDGRERREVEGEVAHDMYVSYEGGRGKEI